jgi:hypothetical protein
MTAPAVCTFNLDEDIMTTAVKWSQQQPRSSLQGKPKVTGLSPGPDGTSVFISIQYYINSRLSSVYGEWNVPVIRIC